MPFFYIDYYYLYFVIPPLILMIIAQINIKRTFSKYEKIQNQNNYTGAEVARMILNKNGLENVDVQYVQGSLTDHYDPRVNVVRLSQSTYSSRSVGAIGVAAHEVGHAIQHNKGYLPIKLRKMVLPISNIGSSLGLPLAILGIIFSWSPLIQIGIILFLFVILFQLVTLPVEFNASKRAIKTLNSIQILNSSELVGAKKVLNAAALTYISSLLISIGNLLRLLALSKNKR